MEFEYFIMFNDNILCCVVVLLQFPASNIGGIMRKLASCGARDQLSRNDPTGGSGLMSIDQFRSLLHQVSNNQLTEHEITTVARHHADRKDDRVDAATLVAISQETLRKVNFENFSIIIDQCVHYDTER